MTDVHIRTQSNRPRTKIHPQSTSWPVPFTYIPSDDGTDENLLILLHGLGDTHVPFTTLGRSLNLPQTAILALQAPEQIPFLYEQAFQWYTSFSPLGEIIERPNPTPALSILSKLVDHLIGHCTWNPAQIHFFGFAQGGSVAAEFGVVWWKSELERIAKAKQGDPRSLGSIVTVSGPLLSYPTPSKLNKTPILVYHRPETSESSLSTGAITAFKKCFEDVNEVRMKGKREGMPSSKDEWEPIMRLWSERLGRRQTEGLYEVMSGGLT